jgi:hypothetical protein
MKNLILALACFAAMGCGTTILTEGGGEISLGGDDDDTEDTDTDDDDAEPTGACFGDLVPRAFDYPDDAASCSGAQYVRFVPEQGLWLGLVSCGNGSARFYLSGSESGPFYQATDTAGHGQDHCELVRPGFVLPNEDDITTGCSECSTGKNIPLEYEATYSRANAGEPFEFVTQTGTWSSQYSQLDCGCGL